MHPVGEAKRGNFPVNGWGFREGFVVRVPIPIERPKNEAPSNKSN